MTETAPTLIVDDLTIRNLIAKFGLACTRHDRAAFEQLWAPNGVWRIGEPHPQSAQGPEDVGEMLDRFWQGNDYFMQFTVQGPIEIDHDEARSQSLCQEFAKGPGRYYRTNGIWSDRLVRHDGTWLFAERSYEYLWLDFSPFTGDIFPGVAQDATSLGTVTGTVFPA